ncbi:hypothetical protein [Sphingomonas mollis]|uniref:Uncharacterized protein n=1 Tax=Sphingomonas mollis TaxID=2795726 RepID=A0ABS0XRT5_9SPHN|nr:hypothetical protein [Sphingomonas sp. BT553]MBJ6122754.1 hypothetical protein [Sphingomonas sp. BT553]
MNPVTTGLHLRTDGAWIDQHSRCMPAFDDTGPLTVLVALKIWDSLSRMHAGATDALIAEVTDLATRHGRWCTLYGLRALAIEADGTA